MPETNCTKARAFIFDLDGTLVRSAVDFVRLKRDTLSKLTELGIDTTDLSEKMRTYEITGRIRELDRLGKLGIPCSTVLLEVTKVWDRVELETVHRTERMPGAERTLNTIKAQGRRVGVATRGCRTYAVEALRVTELLSFIDVILGRDDTVEAKPSPEPLFRAMTMLNVEKGETIMVGDTVEDAVCAKRAGIAFIGVLSGLSDKETLGNVEGALVLRSIEELSHLLEGPGMANL